MSVSARPATLSDLADLTALQVAEDAHWFGAAEHDASEVRESLVRAEPLHERSRVLHDGGQLVAAGWWANPEEATLVVREGTHVDAVYDDLLPWFSHSGVRELEALRPDERRRTALERHGWRYVRSQFELARDTSTPPPSHWPDGVTISGFADEHAAAVHRVIYEEAGWAEVPGHAARDLEDWRSLFVEREDPQQQVLAWQDGRLVGVALGKTFSDGMGWISQLAVPRDLRGRGLGSALLAEALRRRLDGGASQLGLGVSAANPSALRLYEGVGFAIDREWMAYRAPEYRERTFRDVDMRGARIVGADLSRVVMRGVQVDGMEVDAPWLDEGAFLRVNGVDVIPLVDDALNRQFPGRAERRADTAEGLRSAWAALERAWSAAVERVSALPSGTVDVSVAGEWSFKQTLQHLVLATDMWLGRAVLELDRPFHPLGLIDTSTADDGFDLSVFTSEEPSFDDVLEARAGRIAMVRDFLAQVTDEDLRSMRRNPHDPQYDETTLSCLHVILQEEWEHLRYALRDLDTLSEATPT